MTNQTSSQLTLRPAVAGDAFAIARLAALDSADTLTGEVLLAESRGHPVAALSLRDGRAVADPFTSSAQAVALLQLRAGQLGRRETARARLGFLRPAAHRALAA
jgi:hypothetical protein